MPTGFRSPCWFGLGKPAIDSFPQGMKGKSKKLQDFFTDRKVARHERGKIPLLVAPEGILWVVGMRQDERFVVRRGTTRCLVVSVSNRASEKE